MGKGFDQGEEGWVGGKWGRGREVGLEDMRLIEGVIK